eukprot:TRINITY_DN762_c0_g1_i2.p1 TRINITY_DN762_c0_g1~~TRINITY_DN762_c0_g1_i2.p1  ORF type:complete len:222 (+),score=50.95 TRINITY_DN762_c0_g1_i2:67-732(+)
MSSKTLEQLLTSANRTYVVDNKGEKTEVSALKAKGGVVGIYFSAHWCPPCRGFTPVLAKLYNQVKADGNNFEVVFVSSDSDEGSFAAYHSEMPWLALPFSDRQAKADLSAEWGVSGIPALVLVDAETGQTITKQGRARVNQLGASGFPWNDEKMAALEQQEREKYSKLPAKVTISLHPHELELREKVYQGQYGCDACNKGGSGWAYHCDACQFDVHPECAK